MPLSTCSKVSAIGLSFFILGSSNSFSQNSSTVYRVNFKTEQGKFLSATRKSEETVEAIVDDANTDELFVLEDENGGVLQSGDAVRLYAHSGYITIDNSSLLAATGRPDEIVEFKIIKADGNGPINPGDKIELETATDEFISAEDNGKMKVQNGASSVSVLTLTSGVDNAAIADAFSSHWNRGYNITFDNTPQAIFGKKLQNPKTITALSTPGKQKLIAVVKNTKQAKSVSPSTKTKIVKTQKTVATAKQQQAKTAANNGLPSSLPLGYYKCYVDHVANLALAGYFTLLPDNKYVYHGYDPNKRTGTIGTYHYDPSSGKINWLSGSWKTNNYYGIFSLDKVYGDRIYLIPNGSDYSACKCFLQGK